MAYDDFYIDKVTMRGNCDVDSTGVGINEHADDAPGQPAGCKFLAPGEPATTERANRTRLQLAENCDILKVPLDAMIAVGRVAALNSFGPASSITINPLATGGSDVEFSAAGYLYVGNATDYSDNQESRDTLFQLVDEDYNEVLVGGTEVKITAVAPVGAVPGNGFYNAGAVTLTLSDTIPSGNYRLIYARDMTLATMPDDALIRSEIRGVHEAAGESGLKGVRVLDPSSAPALPADFIGPTALQDALAALGDGCTLFLRDGAYSIGALDISQDRVRIIGESGSGVDLQAGANDFVVSGNQVSLENLKVNLNTGQKMSVTNTLIQGFRMIDVYVDQDLEIGVGGGLTNLHLERVTVISDDGFGVSIQNTFYGSIKDCQFSGDAAATAAGLELTSVTRLTFTNTSISGATDRALYIHETGGAVSQLSFTDCDVQGAQGATQPSLDIVTSGGGPGQIQFDNCKFSSSLGVGVSDVQPIVQLDVLEHHSIAFRNCWFNTTNRALFDSGSVDGQLILDNCVFTQTTSGVVTFTGDEIFVLTRAVNVGEVSVRNLTVRVSGYDSGGVAAVSMDGVVGSNVKIDFSGLTPVTGDEMVYLSRCYLTTVGIDFNNHTPDTTAATASAAIAVRRDSVINDLYIKGLDGDWSVPGLPLISIEGIVGDVLRAEVNRMRIESAGTWGPHPLGAIRIEHHATLRNLEIFGNGWDDTYTLTTLIAMGLGSGDCTEAKLLDSHIEVGFGLDLRLYNVVAVYDDGEGFEICDNTFIVYPYELGADTPPNIFPRKVIAVGYSATSLSWPDPTFDNGCKFGKISNNKIRWRNTGVPYDLDPALASNGALIFMTDTSYFCSINDNIFIIENVIPSGNYAVWMDNSGATIGGATSSLAADGEVNGHTFYGNKAWAVDQVATGQGILVYKATGNLVGGDTTTNPYGNQAVGNTV